MDTIAALNRRFGLGGAARVVAGNGGLPVVRVEAPAAAGDIYLHGAHVTSWRSAVARRAKAEEVLFVSDLARWEDGRAIRGGVPICFPWFGDKAGDPAAPAHGFVRTKAWSLDAVTETADGIVVAMSTASDAATRALWPADFRLVHRVTFGARLRLDLEVTNTGATPLTFEAALHTYHRVGAIDGVRVRGLDGVRYLDKTDAGREHVQQGEIVFAAETDRVYLDTSGSVEIDDGALRRRTRIAKTGSRTTVVWNPWIDKARALADLGDEDWRRMLCIEGSNVSPCAVTLSPGAVHAMGITIDVEDA